MGGGAFFPSKFWFQGLAGRDPANPVVLIFFFFFFPKKYVWLHLHILYHRSDFYRILLEQSYHILARNQKEQQLC